MSERTVVTQAPNQCKTIRPARNFSVHLAVDTDAFQDALAEMLLKLTSLGAAFARYDHAMHSERNRKMHTAYRARARRRTRSNR